MFYIKMINEVFFENEEPSIECIIKIEEFSEKFIIPTEYWGKLEYVESWKRSIAEGCRSNTHSILISSMHDPSYLNFIFSWIIYYSGDDAYVQNKIIFLEDLIDFDVKNINAYIGVREKFNEDGDRISEWKTSKASVLDFYNSL